MKKRGFRGWKATEGVVSDDNRFMLFQDGRGGMESGQGFSIYLHDFTEIISARTQRTQDSQ